MLYFIPGWYAGGQWCEQEQNWHVRRMHTEFDDTVKHVQLFHRNGVCPFQIALLSYAPNFRHFLHRQGVYHAPYWSCFDAIQCIERKKAMLLSYHNLKWPQGTEFIYTMFVVVAMLNGEKYAQIEFGEDGNPIEVDLYADGRISRKNLYDDRGFLSSTVVYEEGIRQYQDYLNEKGIWKIRVHFDDGHVEVNEKQAFFRLECGEDVLKVPFSQRSYPSLEAVLLEVFTAFVANTDQEDLFCAAMHPQHLGLLEQALAERRLIVSFYENRCSVTHPAADTLIRAAGQIVCDSIENEKQLCARFPQLANCTVIPPFDTRPDFGISLQLSVQKVLVPVDRLEDDTFERLIRSLGRYLLVNENAQIHLFTRCADYDLDQKLLSEVRRCLALEQLSEDYAAEEASPFVSENRLDSLEQIPKRFFVNQCVDELAVSQCLRQQRLIVDFRNTTDTYLRIVAISMGIPQILAFPSEFVNPLKNGLLLKDMGQLHHAMGYYLDSLTHWNNAMIHSYEIGKEYSTSKQVEKWKGVIDSFE